MMMENKNWYALYTKPRAEFKAELQLKANDIETYLPVITRVKQWSDRKKVVTEAALGSYIFIKADEKERLKSLECDKIVRTVFDRGKPAIIPEFQIENLKTFLQKDKKYTVVNGLVKGATVRIKEGPFAGVEGILIDEPGNKSIAVSIDLLNRSVVAQITSLDIVEVIKYPEQVNN